MTNEKPGYKKGWAVILLIVLGIIVFTNMGNKPNESKPTPSRQPAPIQEEEEIVAIFDIEALYGQNIDEIRAVLGEPTDGEFTNPTEQQLALGTKEWSNTFEKDKYELLVTYDVSNKKVIDFFIGTDDPSGVTKETKKLVKILNIENSNNYTIEPVKALKNPSVYTGIIVIPK